MGNYRDHRPSRSDRFNGEHDPADVEPSYFQRKPPASNPPSGPTSVGSPALDAEVVWFSPKKGFGFVKLSDGSEAFLHASKLEAIGQTNVVEGSNLKVFIETSAKGKPQVSRVVSIERTPGHAAARQTKLDPQQPGQEEQLGSVKRYDTERGFGFIKLSNGGGDVFVHATTLSCSGLATLEVGQSVYISCAQSQKGLEARSVRKA